MVMEQTDVEKLRPAGRKEQELRKPSVSLEGLRAHRAHGKRVTAGSPGRAGEAEA